MEKRERRTRRARRVRARAALDNMYRLCVHRTPRHMYAQIISPDGKTVLASASTVQKALRETLGATGNKEAAAAVGKLIAERAREAGVDRVTFDRSGFRYHGRVRELAEAARESGLQF